MDKLHSLDSDNKYRTILDVDNAIISNLRLGDLYRDIADKLKEILKFDVSTITLYDWSGDVGVDKISKYFESSIGQNQLSYK